MESTDAVSPEYSLLQNFPIQTRQYPFPKITKKLPRTFFSHSGSSSYFKCTKLFVKKKLFPSNSNNDLFFIMIIEYRFLNSVIETFQFFYFLFFLPRISEIFQKKSGKKLYCVLNLKSTLFPTELKRNVINRNLHFVLILVAYFVNQLNYFLV